MRRVSPWIIAVIGVALAVTPVVLSLFDRASAAEDLSGAVRSSMTTEGQALLKSDFDVAFAAGDQFIQKTIPAVASALHQTSAQFGAYVGANFPHVATGVGRWYEMSDDARNDISIIAKNKPGFDAADAIPISSVSLTTGVWGFVALGGALFVAGIAGARLGGRAPMVAALGLGVAAIAIPVAISFPHKASQTNDTIRSIRNVLSRQEVDTLQTNLGVVEQMVPELTGKLIPALEQKLHMTPDAFGTFVQQNFPAVATGLQNFVPILSRMQARVSTMDAGVPLYSRTAKIRFNLLPWLFIAPGALTVLLSGAGLAERVRTPSP